MVGLLVMVLLFASLLPSPSSSSASSVIPSDASALLAFQVKADLKGKLGFSSNYSLGFCKWNGVKCSEGKVVRLVCERVGLDGVFAPDTLTRLDQLRVLSLQDNSLAGPIPDLSRLVNLKVLFLDSNLFSGLIPPSISTLHRLKTLDLSHNNLTGNIPASFNGLDRLYYLRLDSNRLNGSVPALNQTTLQIFNVSQNILSGPIPVTPTLSRFRTTAFASNKALCGEIIHKECRPIQPFFHPSPATTAPPPHSAKAVSQNAQLRDGGVYSPEKKSTKRSVLIIGLSLGFFVLICSIICFALAAKRSNKSISSSPKIALDPSVAAAETEAVMRIEEESNELEEKVKRVQEGMQVMGKSGNLVFSVGESQVYTLEQLMKASAELLGRGTLGTTYKAVLDNRLIVCVKRLDSGKMAGSSKDEFERHMESVGGLRHPNLVPLRAYFQAKEERLLVYDYQPNGSLFSLIHGSKSSRAKPLHWTSCLKIAEDVAQGLSYIHQAWRLVHGNLKSSNVLLGSDFEACISDYCLSVLANPFSDDDPDCAAYKAPEVRKLNPHHQATSKSDVYSYGVLVLELLTGKHPSEHPVLMPDEMMKWVRSTRDDDDGREENGIRLGMILEVAMVCSVASPEQRPTMWQVLKMIQEIKDAAIMEEDGREMDLLTGT
ncbi:PREDICTED: probable inactive receptor kinase At5g67200 [Ipomoea nil]|uniref:probable inactive receptor kinase At5g67200 n=1 Tax=Ipomoea nil TaxID=35883 RepID=UPI000900DD75|nr:PREDICTED: probable inactive receptor kinase At5g67200 [Ipomoea nil]